jgi:hypothetical protein
MFQTTNQTLSERKEGIDTFLLSQTFRDAIAIVRRLNIRYLWIDSLCIIQDDRTDWETESAKMSSIYRLSTITIAAAATADNQGGCFAPTPTLSTNGSWQITPLWNPTTCDPEMTVGFQLTSGQSHIPSLASKRFLYAKSSLHKWQDEMAGGDKRENGEYFKGKPHTWDLECAGHCIALLDPSNINQVTLQNLDNDNEAPQVKQILPHLPSYLSSGVFVRRYLRLSHGQFETGSHQHLPPSHLAARAWTFQERLLSTRILHYTDSELFWECNSSAKCQCFAMEYPIFDEPFYTQPTLKIHFEDQNTNIGSIEDLVMGWMTIVFHYSPRFLSCHSDRLPALSGLAKRFQEHGKLGEYIAGLWSNHLDRQLCWAPSSAQGRPPVYTAPSWSWASLPEGTGVFFANKWFPANSVGEQCVNSTIVSKISDLKCTLAGLDPTGAVSDGYIAVTGQAIHAVLLVSARKRKDEPLPKGVPPPFSNEYDKAGNYISYKIKRQTTDAEHPFVPDSTLDFGTSEREHMVTLLLWAVYDRPLQIPGRERACHSALTCLVLRPVKDKQDKYVRVGLFRPQVEPDEHSSELTCAQIAQLWFQDAPERQFTII